MLDKIPLKEVKDVTRGDKELMKMFAEWDTNHNGLISREEFEQVLDGLHSHPGWQWVLSPSVSVVFCIYPSLVRTRVNGTHLTFLGICTHHITTPQPLLWVLSNFIVPGKYDRMCSLTSLL